MVQGGAADSRNAAPGIKVGSTDAGYTVPAEFHPALFHKKGALAAARDNNPEKASSSSQFYLVQGKVHTPEELAATSQKTGAKYTQAQIEAYSTLGGTPHLDQGYTVFGKSFMA
jgi:cyclophilin family peptidyl-prolyl cis-trans isomerase